MVTQGSFDVAFSCSQESCRRLRQGKNLKITTSDQKQFTVYPTRTKKALFESIHQLYLLSNL